MTLVFRFVCGSGLRSATHYPTKVRILCHRQVFMGSYRRKPLPRRAKLAAPETLAESGFPEFGGGAQIAASEN